MLLAHERSGSGPALILIHGITECRELWRPLIEPLAQQYDVLAVDLRGHGDSSLGDAYDPVTLAADVHETASSLDITNPLVIGHSLGGVVASAYATVARPRAIINVDQPLKLADFKAALGELEPMLRGDEASFQTAIGLIFDAMLGPLPADEVARIGALRHARQDVVLAIWGTVFDSSTGELDEIVEALVAAVTVPYLSLHGIDPGEGYTSWLRRLMPSATVEVWPDQGHYPHLIQPTRFLERVVDFDHLLTSQT
jgi:pimeloyl-ACP methyl ester carboxylesterase